MDTGMDTIRVTHTDMGMGTYRGERPRTRLRLRVQPARMGGVVLTKDGVRSLQD